MPTSAFKSIVVGASAFAMTAGCVSVAPTANAAPKDDKPKTRIYLDEQCPGESRPNAIGEVFISLLLKTAIETTINGIGNALIKAGEKQKTQVQIDESTHFYAVNWAKSALQTSEISLRNGCITIVHGVLAPPPPERAPVAQLRERVTDAEKKLIARFRPPEGSLVDPIQVGQGYQYLAPSQSDSKEPILEFTDDIRFYGRFAVSRSDDLTALKLEPRAILIGDRFVPKKRGSSGKRDIVTTLGLHAPGQTGTAEAFALANVPFKNAKSGTYLAGEDASSLSSGWFPPAALPKSVQDRMKRWDTARRDLLALTDMKTSLQDELDAVNNGAITLTPEKVRALNVKIAETDREIDRHERRHGNFSEPFSQASPITVRVTLTETQDGNKFLVDLGNTITSKSKEIAEPIFETFDPATRRANALTEANNESALRKAAILAVDAFNDADAITGTDRDETTVRSTRIDAEVACRNLRAAGYSVIDCIGF